MFFDLHLNKKDRKDRRGNEGFGDDEFGSNEVEIFPKLVKKSTTTDEMIKDLSLFTPPDQPNRPFIIPNENNEIFTRDTIENYYNYINKEIIEDLILIFL